MKNKYEDIEMIDLEDKVDDIVEIYINRLYNTDKTVGVITSKDIAEYILDNLVELDETSIKEVDLIDYLDLEFKEYFVSVDDCGAITVIPVEDFIDLRKTDIFYIDMDGDIRQEVIDYCVNENKEVILFGQDDEDEGCNGNCGSYYLNESDKDKYEIHTSEDVQGNTHGFMASKVDGDSYMSYSYYSSDELSHEDIQKMLNAFGF